MDIEILENDETVRLRISDLTFVNLLNESIWKRLKKTDDFSAYRQAHPYLEQPILTVRSKDAKKLIIEAAESIQSDTEDMKKKLIRAFKD